MVWTRKGLQQRRSADNGHRKKTVGTPASFVHGQVRADSRDYGQGDTTLYGVAALCATLLDYEDMRYGHVAADHAHGLPEMDFSQETAV